MDFEEAFSEFIDDRECEHAQRFLFSIIRNAFLAGWTSAGGKAPYQTRQNSCPELFLTIYNNYQKQNDNDDNRE